MTDPTPGAARAASELKPREISIAGDTARYRIVDGVMEIESWDLHKTRREWLRQKSDQKYNTAAHWIEDAGLRRRQLAHARAMIDLIESPFEPSAPSLPQGETGPTIKAPAIPPVAFNPDMPLERWPIADVLEHLADAADHLLTGHDCARHGHEVIKEAAHMARHHIAKLRAPVPTGTPAWDETALSEVANDAGELHLADETTIAQLERKVAVLESERVDPERLAIDLHRYNVEVGMHTPPTWEIAGQSVREFYLSRAHRHLAASRPLSAPTP